MLKSQRGVRDIRSDSSKGTKRASQAVKVLQGRHSTALAPLLLSFVCHVRNDITNEKNYFQNISSSNLQRVFIQTNYVL